MTAIVDFEDTLHLAQKALQCPICLETMSNPVLTKCGHRFCGHCLNELLKRKKQETSCPLCKQLMSKRSLANQSKFGNIIQVMQKLADAFQEDLMNPDSSGDWFVDTLDRDSSQAPLDTADLRDLLGSQHSLVAMTSSSLMPAKEARATSGTARLTVDVPRDCQERSRQQLIRGNLSRAALISSCYSKSAEGPPAELAADGQTARGRSAHEPEEGVSAPLAIPPGAAADCVPASNLPPLSPVSVSSGTDSDSPVVIAHEGSKRNNAISPAVGRTEGIVMHHHSNSEKTAGGVASLHCSSAFGTGMVEPCKLPPSTVSITSPTCFRMTTNVGVSSAGNPMTVAIESCRNDKWATCAMDVDDNLVNNDSMVAYDCSATAGPSSLVVTEFGLSLQDVELAQQLAKRHSGRFQTTFTTSVTHIVVHLDDSHAPVELPAKVYLGIASRCFILKVDWIHDSLQQGRLLCEEPYMLRVALSHSDSAAEVPQVVRTVGPGVLVDWEVCCYTSCNTFSADELHELIRLCGARMVRDPASFSFRPQRSRIILVQRKGARTEAIQAYSRLGRLFASPVADYAWLLQCVVSNHLFLPKPECDSCYMPGSEEQWNPINVPALFTKRSAKCS